MGNLCIVHRDSRDEIHLDREGTVFSLELFVGVCNLESPVEIEAVSGCPEQVEEAMSGFCRFHHHGPTLVVGPSCLCLILVEGRREELERVSLRTA